MVLLRIREAAGPVAHLVERLICTEEAGGSNPLGSTTKEMSDLYPAFFSGGAFGRGFEDLLRQIRPTGEYVQKVY